MERMRACAWGLRRTWPTSMFGREKSAPKRARPVTLSTPSGRTGRVPTHLRFLPLLDIRLAPCRRGGGGCTSYPRRSLRVNGESRRYYGTRGGSPSPRAPRRGGGRIGGGAGSGPAHRIGGIGGAGELERHHVRYRAAEPGRGWRGVRPPRGESGIRRARLRRARDVPRPDREHLRLARGCGRRDHPHPSVERRRPAAPLPGRPRGQDGRGARRGVQRPLPSSVSGVGGEFPKEFEACGVPVRERGRAHERGPRCHPPSVDRTGRLVCGAVQHPERVLDRPDADPVAAPHLGWPGGAMRP